MTITFIGGGNMATALIGGLVRSGETFDSLGVVEINAEAAQALALRFPVRVHAQIDAASTNVDLIVLAVKPQQIQTVAHELAPYLSHQLVLSIAAGIELSHLSHWLNGYGRLVRAMPNTPALVGAGIAGLFALAEVDQAGRDAAERILAAAGKAIWFEHEEALDAVTAVSGSGPAYVFYFLEALEEAARELGIDPQLAKVLTYATFSGALQLAEQSSAAPHVLRLQVTSKGGTTEQAIAVMELSGVKATIVQAVKAAAARARELNEQFGSMQ